MWILLLASGLALAGLRAFGAQPAQAEPLNQDVAFSVEGKITDLAPGKLTVDSGGGMNFNVRYDSKTAIENANGTPVKTSDLREGLKIKAEGTLTESGDVVAKRIVIESDKK